MHVPSAKKFGRPATLPEPLDSTLALLRPFVDAAGSCNDPPRRLTGRGYGPGCCDGRPVILNANGLPISTGRCPGVPLRLLAGRLGRATIGAGRDGRSGRCAGKAERAMRPGG